MKTKWLLDLSLIFASAIGVTGVNFAYDKQEAVPVQAKEQISIKNSAFSDYGGTDLIAEDSTVTYAIKTATRSEVCQSYGIYIENTGTESYMLGYYGQGNEYKPLTVVYDVTTAGKTGSEERTFALSQVASNTLYDGVGSDLGATSFSTYADIYLSEDETIDVKSIKLINVYKSYRDAEKSAYLADFTKPYYLQNATVESLALKNYNASKFISVKLDRIGFFEGFTSIECSYENLGPSVYKDVYGLYASHAQKIATGVEAMRFRFNAVTNSTYIVNMKDGTTYTAPVTGSNYMTLQPNEGKLRFLISGVNPSEIASFYLGAATYYIDLINVSTNKQVVGSVVKFRYGALNFNHEGSIPVINLNLILILAFLGYCVVFAGAAFFIYRYRKDKYKNDEYLRVEWKQYIKTSSSYFFALAIMLLDIIFIVGRANIMSNSIVVYNPMDVYIILLSIALIIFIGWFIKYFISLFKARQEKRKTDALKLNDTKSDDGTVTLKK